MKRLARRGIWLAATLIVLAGCSSKPAPPPWVDDDVTFEADGVTLYGTYHHRQGDQPGPAALLISESGQTDRNGDNAVAGPVANMRKLADLLAERGVATLRYDKVGTGRTGLGTYAKHPADVGSAVYTSGAKAAVRFLAHQAGTDKDRISVYALGEGTVHAMNLAVDKSANAPKIHSLGLLQPLAGRYLDQITERVRNDAASEVKAGRKTQEEADQVVAAWTAAVVQARHDGTAPAELPDGLGAVLNAKNVNAVVQADAINPIALAMLIPAATPVLLTCSDSDAQADCRLVQPLADALKQTQLDFVKLTGVSHVLKDDPTDSILNYAKDQPLSPQLVPALDRFASK
ncbi:hypothetical protein [Mycobacterium sp.]|uniref:hypothetical protein n=1 Tax=Mycobacterium sp. TaxID=1785 RepID=UPI002D48B089|nr:hypothetical protein [Mycobacterium sp.]HZA11305.1 hypothetical protein [Mycobacterium sp.]